MNYAGGVERLHQELDRKQARLEKAYVRALGPRNAQKILDVAERVLPKQAFFDSIEAFDQFTGEGSPADRHNTFTVLADSGIDDTDWQPLQPTTISMAPLMYISEKGFNPHSTDRTPETILSSYVHNWNKFVWFAVQDPPMYTMLLNKHGTPETLIPYILKLDMSMLHTEEIIARLNRAALSNVIHEIHGCITDLLDRVILDEIGVRVNIGWRNKVRGYTTFSPTPKKGIKFMLPWGGDPFYSHGSNISIIRGFVDDWSEFIGPKGFSSDEVKDKTKALLQSVAQNVAVNKVPVTEFIPRPLPD